MASGTDSQGNSGQAAIDRFAAMMIERMQQMKDTGWKQGWIGCASGYAGLPQNVGGRNYSGSNSFFLQMHTAAMNYQPEFGISDSRFSCYARFPIGAYYICPPNNMDGKMQNCKV